MVYTIASNAVCVIVAMVYTIASNAMCVIVAMVYTIALDAKRVRRIGADTTAGRAASTPMGESLSAGAGPIQPPPAPEFLELGTEK